jgi:NAD(P)-dependent dehydrogenase (short-subunit alcohol dehydrogenase family)
MTQGNTSSKAIIVTGASGGIGSAIARRLLQDGYHVIGTYHRGGQKLSELAREFPSFETAALDMSSRASITDFVASLDGRVIYGLVNNAGVIEFEDFNNFDLESWRRIQDVNVQGVLQLSLNIRTQMSRPASIVNIASTDAFLGGMDTMAYAASKAALVSLTRSLAVNMGPDNVRVNAIAPGWIDTPMGTKLPAMAIEHTPLGRLGTPADIAGIVAFLMSDDAGFVTGTTIVADGGYYCLDPVMKAEKLLNDTRLE